jgi:maltose O-acetyltransferase
MGSKPNSLKKPLIQATNFLMDRILHPLRALLFPFYLLTRFKDYLGQAVWELSNAYVTRRFASCGRGVRIHGRFRVTAPQQIHLGDNVHINDNAFIRAEGGLTIGDNTHISRNLVIYTMNHQYEGTHLPYDQQKILKPVSIGRNVWIGMNVVIAPGTSIGDGAIIGMGTIVAKDVPPLTIVGSAPQHILKTRGQEHYHGLEEVQRYSGMSGYPLETSHKE